MLQPETMRKLMLMSKIGEITLDQVVDDAVALYYDVYEVDRIDNGKPALANDEMIFKDFVYRCRGSLQVKGRIYNLLIRNGIDTKQKFMEAPIGEMILLPGVGRSGRRLLTEMIQRETTIRKLPKRM